MALYWYVHRNYTILKTAPTDNACINQRWDAFVHQVAAFIHTNTDLMLLTIFSDLYQVSVYSIYNMVVTGVKKFVCVFTSGIESAIGKLIVKKESELLSSFVDIYEWGMNVISTTVFGCTAILIVPFVKVYTTNVVDAEYIQPILGYLLVFAAFLACVRLPYQNMVEAAGHFRQTRNGAIAEASVNIGVSLTLIVPFGSIGVAIGTVLAMAFRTVQYALYSSKHILKKPCLAFIKRVIVTTLNILVIFIPYLFCKIDVFLLNNTINYFIWIIEAVVIFIAILLVTLLVNVVAYKKTSLSFIRFIIGHKLQKTNKETDDLVV